MNICLKYFSKNYRTTDKIFTYTISLGEINVKNCEVFKKM